MPGKIFQARLEKLFSKNSPVEIETDRTSAGSTSPGWVWDCDDRGTITFCSPEVELVLGIPANEFVNQNLLDFRLAPSSINQVIQFFQDFQEPKNILVSYRHQSGVYLPVNLYMLGQWIADNGMMLVRGFAQLQVENEAMHDFETALQSAAISDHAPEKESHAAEELVSQAEENLRKIKITSQLIIEMLKHLKETDVGIRQAKISQIVTKTEKKMMEDTSSEAPEIQYLFGKRVVNYPSIPVLMLEHRLEWGNKLDLTSEEKEFVTNSRYQDDSILRRIRQFFAPKTIQKAEKSWFSVIIRAEGDQPATILIQNGENAETKDILRLSDFLSDPLTLLPYVRQSIEHPRYTNEMLLRGKDYLIKL